MIVSHDQLTVLREIVNQHVRAPTAAAIATILNSAISKQLTLEQVHEAIDTELNKPSARGSFLARTFRQTGQLEDNFAIDLLVAIVKQKNRLQEEKPVSPHQFIRDLFVSHIEHGDDNNYFIDNALVELIKYYKKIHNAYSETLKPENKHYFSQQLSILISWTNQQGYLSLIKIIYTCQNIIINPAINSLFNAESIKKIQETPLIFLWFGVAIDRLHASESAFAMREVLKSNLSVVNFSIEEDRNSFVYQINQFKSFYIDANSPSSINIDSEPRQNLLNNIARLNHANMHKNIPQLEQARLALIINLNTIYDKLDELLTYNRVRIKEAFLALEKPLNEETLGLFKEYLNTALNYTVNSADKVYQKTSRDDFYPLEISANKFIFFTPDNWAISNNLSNQLSRRLSSKSSFRSNSSHIVKSGESSSGKESNRTTGKSPDLGQSSRERLMDIFRTHSVTSLNESASSDSLADSLSSSHSIKDKMAKSVSMTDTGDVSTYSNNL